MRKITCVILSLAMLVCCFAFTAQATPNDDYTVLGKYVANGYENEYFKFKIKLPAGFELVSRAKISAANESVIAASNNESTLSLLKTTLSIYSAMVFAARSDMSNMSVTIRRQIGSLGKEKEIAENMESKVIEKLQERTEQGDTITDIQTLVVEEVFIGGMHYGILYKCLLNGADFYGAEVYVRSADAKYLAVFDFTSLDAHEIERMWDSWTKI